MARINKSYWNESTIEKIRVTGENNELREVMSENDLRAYYKIRNSFISIHSMVA